ncbi:MAG TPA: hypothetical protein VGK73_34925 [Polyangiaceae bacterium]
MNDSARRRLAYPDLYGKPECPGAGIRPRTPRYGKWRDARGMFLRSAEEARVFARAEADKLRQEMHAERPGSAR